MSKVNPFLQFTPKTETIVVKSLGNAEVTVRQLSQGEGSEISKGVFEGLDAKGEPVINVEKAIEAKFERVAAMLVEPAMTVDELKGLTSDVMPVIDEILTLTTSKTEEGND